jgi:predicted anti-sigma-YlaC factor YlaD
MIRALPLLALVALLPLSTGCINRLAMNAMADALSSSSGGAFTQDDDLQLVGDALPFTLKTMETIHTSVPEHEGLVLSLASGFTQYAMVYAVWPAEQQKYTDLDAYERGLERGRRLLARARRYGFEGLELAHGGFKEAFQADADAALAPLTAKDVPLLYWAGAATLARISISKTDPEAIGELPGAAAMIHRALALDPTWGEGSIHELLVQLEPSLPLPGGNDRARTHYAEALRLSGGKRASVYVGLATSISLPAQDKAEFTSLLDQALAIDAAADPANQLANLYAQEQARFLLSRVDDLFLE